MSKFFTLTCKFIKNSTFHYRYIYYKDNGRCIVYYTGDNDVKQQFPHGAATDKKPRAFVATRPQLQEIIENASQNVTTRELQHLNQATTGNFRLDTLTRFRDTAQLKNYRKQVRQADRLRLDEDSNAKAIAHYFGPEVVSTFTTTPTVHVEIMTPAATEELAKLTRLHSRGERPMLFHYDTTYNVGPYYVSTLSLRHDMMKHIGSRGRRGVGEPTVPIAYLIHNTRLQPNHRQFFNNLDERMNQKTKQEWGVTPKVLVTDQEFRTTWKDVPVVLCWKHIAKNLTNYVENRTGSSELTKEAVGHFYNLAKSKSANEYQAKLENLRQAKQGVWGNAAFSNYMNGHVSKLLKENSGMWVMQNLNIPHIENGMTNNAAEGVNNGLKKFVDIQRAYCGERNKELELYQVMLSAKQYADSKLNSIMMAYYDNSDTYRLKSTLKETHALPKEQMPKIDVEPFQDTIKRINDIIADDTRRFRRIDPNDDPLPTTYDKEQEQRRMNKGLRAAAKDLIQTAKHLDFNADGRYYTVVDANERKFDVFLDKNTCSCEDPGWCAHLIATRYKFGVSNDFEVPAFPTGTNKIPPPKHPANVRKTNPSSKAPKQTDFYDATTHGKANKAKQKELPAMKERLTQEMQNTSDSTIEHFAPSDDDRSTVSSVPFQATQAQSKHYRLLTEDITRKLGQYTHEQRRQILREEKERVKALKKAIQAEKKVQEFAPNIGQMAKLNITNDKFYRDQRLMTKSFDYNHIKLNEFDIATVTTDAGVDYGFYNRAPGEVIVYGPNWNADASQFAARAIMHQTQNMTVSFQETNTPLADCTARKVDQERAYVNTYNAVCSCREPHNAAMKEKLIDCSHCPTKYHPECVGLDTIPENWTCALGTVPIRGFQWSAGAVRNTCTVDNFLTAATIEAIKNPEFLDAITKTKYDDFARDVGGRKLASSADVSKAMGKVMQAAIKENYPRAQEIYANMLAHKIPQNPNIKTDLWGSEATHVYDVLKEGGQFYFGEDCTKCSYKEKNELKHNIYVGNVMPLPLLKTFLEEGDFDGHKCRKCPDGVAGKTGLKIPDKNKPPWFLHMDVDMSGHRIREINWVPKELNIDGQAYKFAYSTIQSPGHFSAIMNHENQLMAYDGNRSGPFKFSTINSRDVIQEYGEKIVNSFTWFLDTSKKENKDNQPQDENIDEIA